MERVVQEPKTYDQVYTTGGFDSIYNLPYWRSQYFPLYKRLLAEAKRIGAGSVLEVGCGNGAFAHLCFDASKLSYRGFDFSPTAIEMAKRRCERDDAFFVGDAADPENYSGVYDTIVCSEVLEHIPCDLEVIASWPRGVNCLCSVPNFDSRYHERYFSCRDEVVERYGDMVAIERVTEVYVPLLSDLAIGARAKAALSSVSRPKRLLAILGMPQLATQRRWFVIVGKRR